MFHLRADEVHMRTIIEFLASPTGRFVRFVLGLVIIAVAWLTLTNVTWYVALAIGAFMTLAAIANVCVLAPLIGEPLIGGSGQGS
jgi:hypothetical protein